MNDPRPFWMVWNPAGSPPEKTHATELDARAEASRLAAKHTGKYFVVLQSVCMFTAPPAVQEFDLIPKKPTF